MLYIIFATLIVVVLFQIIILKNQQKNGKLVSEFIAQRNSRNFQSDRSGDRPDRFRDRNNNGNRQNRPPRTEQEFKPRPPQDPVAPVAQEGAVDNMEKSLRDINLKLKNAERDQEVARRKFQDNGIEGGSRDQSRRRHPHENRDGNRGSRDGSRGGRDDNRDHRRGGGDRDRNNRNNWRDRNQDRPFQEERPMDPPDAEVQATSLPVEATTGAIAAPFTPAAAPEMNASDFDSDNTEHGRKIMVKRRLLKDDQSSENSSGSPDENSSESSAAASNAAADISSEKSAGDAEIRFGRR